MGVQTRMYTKYSDPQNHQKRFVTLLKEVPCIPGEKDVDGTLQH